MIYFIFILIKPNSDTPRSVNGDIVIFKAATTIWIEMFDHRLKVNSQNTFIVLRLHFPLREQWNPKSHLKHDGAICFFATLSLY